MKKIFFLTLLITFSVGSYSQSKNRNPELNKDYYIHKRSQNNTVAHFMLWTGFAASITGYGIDRNINFDGPRVGLYSRSRGKNEYKHAGAAIAYTGIIAMAVSIPFFYFATKNKKNARSLSFKNEPIPRILNQNLVYSTVPSVSLKISL